MKNLIKISTTHLLGLNNGKKAINSQQIDLINLNHSNSFKNFKKIDITQYTNQNNLKRAKSGISETGAFRTTTRE